MCTGSAAEPLNPSPSEYPSAAGAPRSTLLLRRRGGRGRIPRLPVGRGRGPSGPAVPVRRGPGGLQGHDPGWGRTVVGRPGPGPVGQYRELVLQAAGQVVGGGAGHRHHRGLAGVVGELDARLADPFHHLDDQVGAELDRAEDGHHIVLGQAAAGPTQPDQGVELVGRKHVEHRAGRRRGQHGEARRSIRVLTGARSLDTCLAITSGTPVYSSVPSPPARLPTWPSPRPRQPDRPAPGPRTPRRRPPVAPPGTSGPRR